MPQPHVSVWEREEGKWELPRFMTGRSMENAFWPSKAGVVSRGTEKSSDFMKRFRRIEFTQKVFKIQEKELHWVKVDNICYWRHLFWYRCLSSLCTYHHGKNKYIKSFYSITSAFLAVFGHFSFLEFHKLFKNWLEMAPKVVWSVGNSFWYMCAKFWWNPFKIVFFRAIILFEYQIS